MPSSPTPTRFILRRAAIGAASLIAAVAFLMTRPWSSRSSWRQMRIFDPAVRVQNFRDMDGLFPTHVVHRGPAPHALEAQLRPLPATYTFRGEARPVDAFLDKTTTTGLLVLKGDTIVAERYFRGAGVDTPFTSWSVAKSIVSLLIGIARDEGKFSDLAADLAHYAPGLAGSDYGRVPLRDALTMSSGIHFSEEYFNRVSDIYTLFARVLYLREGAMHYVASRPAAAPPGTLFHYASCDTFALGLALRSAVGASLASYLQEKLWGPLGMEFDASWNAESDDGAELAFCCVNARLRDYAKIGRLVARGGEWNGKQIVSAAWLAESFHVDPARAPGKLPETSWGYGYQWWIPSGDRGTVLAAGVWGQFIYVDARRGVVIVKTSVDPDFEATSDETIALFDGIADSL